jgi:hypothetical protein
VARFNPESIAKHWPFNRFFAVVTGGFELPKKGYARIELRLQVSFFPNASRRVLVLLWPGVETRSLDAAFVFANGCNRLQPFATVCNRLQPSATVCERPSWGQHGRTYGNFCKSGHFWRFQSSCRLVSRGRRGTL